MPRRRAERRPKAERRRRTVASLTTPTISAVSGGIGCFVAAALIAFAIPALTRYRAGGALATGAAPAETTAPERPAS